MQRRWDGRCSARRHGEESGVAALFCLRGSGHCLICRYFDRTNQVKTAKGQNRPTKYYVRVQT